MPRVVGGATQLSRVSAQQSVAHSALALSVSLARGADSLSFSVLRRASLSHLHLQLQLRSTCVSLLTLTIKDALCACSWAKCPVTFSIISSHVKIKTLALTSHHQDAHTNPRLFLDAQLSMTVIWLATSCVAPSLDLLLVLSSIRNLAPPSGPQSPLSVSSTSTLLGGRAEKLKESVSYFFVD